MSTRKWYRYRRSIRIQENDMILENRSRTGFKLYTTIKIRIIAKLSSRQVGMQASVHPSEAKQAGMKLTYNTRTHHVRRGYCSQHG